MLWTNEFAMQAWGFEFGFPEPIAKLGVVTDACPTTTENLKTVGPEIHPLQSHPDWLMREVHVQWDSSQSKVEW